MNRNHPPGPRGRVVLCMLLFFAMHLSAQEAQGSSPEEAVFASPLNAAAGQRFDQVCGSLSRHPVTAGNFVQRKTISRLGRTLVSQGHFVIARGQGILWDTQKPFPSVLAAGRDYLVQSTPDGKKTKLEASGNETFLRFSETLSAVFSGDSGGLRKNFQIYFAEPAGPGNWIMALVPQDQSLRSFADKIIMTGDAVIRIITLYEKNGDTIRYELSRHEFPGALSGSEKAYFSFP